MTFPFQLLFFWAQKYLKTSTFYRIAQHQIQSLWLYHCCKRIIFNSTLYLKKTYAGQTSDIDCGESKLQYCNNAKWSNQSWNNGNIPGLNLLNPIRKDTIIIPTGGYAVSHFIKLFWKSFLQHNVLMKRLIIWSKRKNVTVDKRWF